MADNETTNDATAASENETADGAPNGAGTAAGSGAAAGAGAAAPQYIKIKAVDQDANEVHFRVKLGTSLGKMKKGYATRAGKDVSSLRFLFDGRRIQDEDTPRSLAMEEDDVIDVFSEMLGGSAE